MQSFELPPEPVIKQHRPQDLRKYSIVPIRACNDRRIRPAAMRALLAVCSYANRAGLCWPSHENVGKMLGVSRQAAGRQIRILRDLGYLHKVKNHSYGRTAQILRVVYDENLADRTLLNSIPFEDLPPEHQAHQQRKQDRLLNGQQEAFNNVAVTASRKAEEELGVDELVSMWKSACSRAGIVRIITAEDRTAAVSMCAKGVSRPVFERVLAEVFTDWQQYRRDPPHRLAWFAGRVSSEATPCPPAPARIDAGT